MWQGNRQQGKARAQRRSLFPLDAFPFFILSGLVGTVGGRFTRFIGIDKVGSSVASAINNLNPFIAAELAIVFLGEQMTLPIVAATAVIVMGTILFSLSGHQEGPIFGVAVKRFLTRRGQRCWR